VPHRSRLLYGLSAGYTSFIALWFTLRLLFFDTIWWLALLNTAAIYLFLPLPLLLGIALYRRSRLIAGILAGPLLLWCWLFGARLLPPTPPTQEPFSTTVSAMTFNVLFSNRDNAAIITTIRAARPDLVGFQEFTPRHMEALRPALELDYPYIHYHKPGREAGVALFSRYPIATVSTFPLPPRNLSIHATLSVGSTPLHIVIVHLSPNRALGTPLPSLGAVATAHYAIQADEMIRILQEVRPLQAPVLMLCDCNLTDTSQAYAALASVLQDGFTEVGWGLGHTYPAGILPLQRYDYVWHSAELVALEVGRWPASGSDHLPVLARFRLRNGSQP
jgi:vancomycin resistance protein VanJ